MKPTILLLIISFFLFTCHDSIDGRYVVSNVKEGSIGNDTVCTLLKKALLGNQYDIIVHDKSISMKSLKSHGEMSLTQETYNVLPSPKATIYMGKYKTDADVVVNITLKHDTSFIMDITLYYPANKPFIMPVQFNAGFGGRGSPAVAVECYLHKLSQ